jgi:hypothetical protein
MPDIVNRLHRFPFSVIFTAIMGSKICLFLFLLSGNMSDAEFSSKDNTSSCEMLPSSDDAAATETNNFCCTLARGMGQLCCASLAQ